MTFLEDAEDIAHFFYNKYPEDHFVCKYCGKEKHSSFTDLANCVEKATVERNRELLSRTGIF